MRYLMLTLLIIMAQTDSFKESQLKKTRVKTAYQEKEAVVRNLFKTQDLSFDGFHLFIRAFKKERELEVWIKEKDKETYSLLTMYPFCSFSGTLGPKRKEGDLQIPEGVYHINHFNPESNFYLSLGVSYPNESDKLLSDRQRPGGAIYVHGNCVTIGCIPITDERIKELYILAVEAKTNGQKKIPIHIFPAKLDDGVIDDLTAEFGARHEQFWKTLQPVYMDFERSGKLKGVGIDGYGQYVMN